MATAASPAPPGAPVNPPADNLQAGGGQLQQNHYAVNSNVLLTAILSLMFIAVLIFMLNLYARYLVMRNVHQRRRAALILFSRGGALPGEPSNPGLDPAIIASLPTFAYGRNKAESGQRGGGGDEPPSSTECAVCLSEMEEGEMVRQLPNCSHVFHAMCIDKWLQSNSTCPICRADVVAPTAADGIVISVEVPVGVSSLSTTARPANGDASSSSETKEVGSTSPSGSSFVKVKRVQPEDKEDTERK